MSDVTLEGPGRPHRWRVAWWTAAILTTLNGLVVGFGSVWFQLFGESPDRGDYLVSAGGYLASAGLLTIGVGAALRGDLPRTAVAAAGTVAFILALLGMGSLQHAAALPPHDRPSAGVLDGIGGVVLLPWSWVLLWMAGRACYPRRKAVQRPRPRLLP